MMIKIAQRLLLPLGMGLSLWFLVVSLAMLGAPTKAQSPSVTGAAINRPQDPVIVIGANLAAHGGAPVNELVLYAYQAGAWTPIPFQIDERTNDITGTYVISDDGLLDANDELVFMAVDTGDSVNNNFGHFRLVFDYFFPGLMPGSPIDIPPSLIDNWDSHYATVIKPAMLDPANADTVAQLLRVTGAAFDANDPATRETTIHNLLWYNVFATNDARAKLGGQPFDNQGYSYTGSNDDAQLNLLVQRFSASPVALAEIEAYYQTTGQLTAPLVTLHTTLDPVAPYWHETLYRGKVIVNDNLAKHDNMPITRYGHCNFTTAEVLAAFVLLVDRVMNPPPYSPSFRHFLPLLLSKVN